MIKHYLEVNKNEVNISFHENLPKKPSERLKEFDIEDGTNLVDRIVSKTEKTSPDVWYKKIL
jgi:hypothetical protein